MTTKGLFGRKNLDIQVRESEVASPNEVEVMVKVHACGVCGTDLNFVKDWDDDYMALGHEISAEVIEVGSRVPNLKPGDTVIIEDVSMCGVCDDCKKGNPQFCRNLFGLNEQPGMGQYMTVRYNNCVPYTGIEHKYACLTEPLAVSLTSVENAQIPLGGSVVVLGAGPLGLMAAKLAKLRGAGFTAITDMPGDNPRALARIDAAKKLDCDLVIEIGKQDVEEAIKKRFPNGVDRVIVSSPPESIYDALKIIRYGGIITYFGLHFGGKSKISIDINDMVFNKITLIPTFAEPAINFPVANQLLRDGLIDPKLLVTHTFTFENAISTFKAILDGTEPIIKAVMLPNG